MMVMVMVNQGYKYSWVDTVERINLKAQVSFNWSLETVSLERMCRGRSDNDVSTKYLSPSWSSGALRHSPRHWNAAQAAPGV